ncbi:MAG: hypothetical protein IIT46_12895 [Lachnospiraceae bacterium]|nr:hypothetical protein [Lachnospiraceae bacterium]
MGIKIIIKSLGRFVWIPIIINDIIIPLIILFIKINGTLDHVKTGIMMLTQMFTPFLAVFWIYLHLLKYIDSKGNENFYLKERNKLLEVVKLTVVYIITNTPFFIWYYLINRAYIYEWIHIIIMSIFFGMGAYFFSYLFKSISLGMIPSFIYALSSITGLNEFMYKISYYESSGMKAGQLTEKYFYFLLIAFLFAGIGEILNKYYTEYNS